MNATDVLCWIVIGGAILFVFGFFLWSLCSIAKLSDESSERYWRENYKEDEEQQDTIEPPKAAGNT